MFIIHESILRQAVGLLVVVLFTVTISWGTLLLARIFCRRTAPFREVILKGGVCLLLCWPLVVFAGLVIGSVTRPAPHIVTGTSSVSESTLTSGPSPSGGGEQNRAVATAPHRETIGTVWTPPSHVASTEPTIQSRLQSSPTLGEMPSLKQYLRVILAVWLAGLMLSLCLLLRDLIRVRRIRRRLVLCSDATPTTDLEQICQSIGLKRTPELWLSAELSSPCTAGARHPVIILPQRLLESKVERDALLGILMHESAHIWRRDVAWSLLVRVVRAIYWWEPGLFFIDRQLSQLREEICDNHVLLAPVDRRVYAKTLLDFAEGWVMRPLVGVIGMMGKQNPLSNRIERMLAEDTQPQTRMSRWSWTGVVCGAVIAVFTVGLMGVWAERAGAVDPLLASSNRKLAPQIFEEPAAAQAETPAAARAETPAADVSSSPAAHAAWSGSPNEASERTRGRSKATSPPARTRGSLPASALAQARTEPREATPAEGASRSDLPESDLSPFEGPVRDVPDRKMVPVLRTRTVKRQLPNGKFVEEPVHYMEYVPEHEVGADRKATLDEQKKTLEVESSLDQTWVNGQAVNLTLSLPETQAQLPRQIVLHGLKVTEPETVIIDPFAPPLSPIPDENKQPEPVAETDQVLPAPEPAKTTPGRRIVLTGSGQTVRTAQWLIELGAVPRLTADMNTEAEEEKQSLFVPQGPRYRLEIDAQADESGKLAGLRTFGREIPIETEENKFQSLQQFLERWKSNCPVETSNDVHVSNWGIIIHVPDSMRYGDAQSLAKSCAGRNTEVHVRGSSPSSDVHLSRVYAAVELTRVYDKQGKPVGPGAILIAHKFGAKEMQIITENHWNQAVQDFANRYKNRTNVLLVNADADVSLDKLRELQILANRVGIEEVRFLTAAVQEALEIRGTDMLVPLLEDLPEPTRSGSLFPIGDEPATDEFDPPANDRLPEL